MRTAIFGGTFDPIHNAHLAVCRAARSDCGIDRVLLVPAALPPHKMNCARETYEDRFRMVELACEGEPGLVPSRLEEGVDRSYSILTIERVLSQLPPGDRLFFLIGADAFAEVTTWYRWEEVVRMVEFIVVNRPDSFYSTPEAARVHRLHSVDMPISSSEIRQKLQAGVPVPELPPLVYDYIRKHGLYLRRNGGI